MDHLHILQLAAVLCAHVQILRGGIERRELLLVVADGLHFLIDALFRLSALNKKERRSRGDKVSFGNEHLHHLSAGQDGDTVAVFGNHSAAAFYRAGDCAAADHLTQDLLLRFFVVQKLDKSRDSRPGDQQAQHGDHSLFGEFFVLFLRRFLLRKTIVLRNCRLLLDIVQYLCHCDNPFSIFHSNTARSAAINSELA